MKTPTFRVMYAGVWMEYGEQQARVFPTLSEAIYHKQWIEDQPWQYQCYWIELSAIRVEML